MTQADSVHSTPPTNTSAVSGTGAAGAVLACQASVIPASRPGASQALASEGEPQTTPPTCSSGAGHSMTRRTIKNSLVALPIAGVPTSSAFAGNTRKPTKEELYAYAEWLANEHSLLCEELWPRYMEARRANGETGATHQLGRPLGRFIFQAVIEHGKMFQNPQRAA